MPDVATHYLFGVNLTEKLPPQVIKDLNAKHDAFVWGLIGPDLLYYRKAMTDKTPLPAYGLCLHKLPACVLFTAATQYIQQLPAGAEKEHLTAYFYGLICHFALDKNVHPYIYYQQNQLQREMPEIPANRLHALLESALDTAFYQSYTGKAISNFIILRIFRLQNELQSALGDFYSYLGHELLSVELPPREVNACFTDMLRINQLLYDPSGGLTYGFTKVYEAIVRQPLIFSSHVKRKKTKLDILNTAHAVWLPCGRQDLAQNSDFFELMEQATTEAIGLIEEAAGYFAATSAPAYQVAGCMDAGEYTEKGDLS